jgi:hypothetical protein
MTTMTLTEEDALFELELRVVPMDGKDEYTRNVNASGGCVHTSYVTEGCTTRCTATYACSYTCRGFATAESSASPNMCI